MVATAAQFEVREIRPSAVDPVLNVVGVAPARRPVAAFGDAAAVACDERPPHRQRNRTGRAADIERRRRAIGDHPCDLRVAGDAPQRLGRKSTELRGIGPHLPYQLASAPAFQHLDIDVQARGGSVRAARTLLQTDRGRFTHSHQGIGAALTGRTQVAGTERIHRRLQRVDHDLARLPVEQPVDRDHPVQEVRHVQAPPFVLRLGPLGTTIPVECIGDPSHQAAELARIDRARRRVINAGSSSRMASPRSSVLASAITCVPA